MEQTLSIIKPDAVKNGFVDDINYLISENGLNILKSKKVKISREIAEKFYSEHSEKPFFSELVEFMTSSDSVVQVLEGKNAVNNYRKLMGATNPNDADEGTLRAKFAESLSKNAVHGSDSLESAQREINIMSEIFD
ncbi:MAG: nucleoside-diphosphate kinase [Pseudomonadota bacterium]|nr:nucleoside-diphosphate kinase [Pseudomonadota bacterium]